MLTPPQSGWTRDLKDLPEFNDVNIRTHINLSGKTIKDGKVLSKPEKRGYQFFSENYIHEFQIVKSAEAVFIKAQCFRSQSKSKPPHRLWCALNSAFPHDVIRAECSCVAGASAFCNHVFALLYQIDHFVKKEFRTVPDTGSKTSVPQVWDKPRLQGVKSQPVMRGTVQKAKASSTRSVKSTLYEARTSGNIANDWDKIKSIQEEMAHVNPLYGFAYMPTPETGDTDYKKTRLGSVTPQGSVLSYQLALTEGDFTVACHPSLTAYDIENNCNCDNSDTALPVGHYSQPTYTNIPQDILNFMQEMSLSMDEVRELEKNTREQSNSDLWKSSRLKRFTASCFGELARKRPNGKWDSFMKKTTCVSTTSVSAMPAPLRHGLLNEDAAAERYKQYLCDDGRPVTVEGCGFVVRPDIPYMGCSPDRKVIDPNAHPHLGIVEVKCLFKYQMITPMEAAQIKDDKFCLELRNGTLQLKTSHKYYYQVQGQMALSGVKWCDFVVYSLKGMFVQRIPYNHDFWTDLHTRLQNLYIQSYVPQLLKLT